MAKLYDYTLAVLVNGQIQESTFVGTWYEMTDRFIIIERVDGIRTLLNFDIVGQLDVKEHHEA